MGDDWFAVNTLKREAEKQRNDAQHKFKKVLFNKISLTINNKYSKVRSGTNHDFNTIC